MERRASTQEALKKAAMKLHAMQGDPTLQRQFAEQGDTALQMFAERWAAAENSRPQPWEFGSHYSKNFTAKILEGGFCVCLGRDVAVNVPPYSAGVPGVWTGPSLPNAYAFMPIKAAPLG
jgi:hypothetical protein